MHIETQPTHCRRWSASFGFVQLLREESARITHHVSFTGARRAGFNWALTSSKSKVSNTYYIHRDYEQLTVANTVY
ncbi:hypothetical protein BDV38DRAFT_263400 [Aspergillus pseudotamarii]|uniref:Uncharacterized protein n=1 Tax=Aspergillus pseudotamarii TaxID=132259 RepID=A0A5N6SAN6_ASPPS|nr:uncharacterized protein BDV38DRAFT_263400 [Aspergillus pseudotamarii]KAE8131772.1 hypothetical protein BDV38DRAFT_263400 [Aspergillus pseudotamarii]